jgi:DNA-binding winged helix-turn-helix (wHTH) protein/tetratricopeptide (TPR) repeat protein
MKLSTAGPKENWQPEFSFGNFSLWPDGTFYRGSDEIHLPPKELAALRYLLLHAGQVVTPAELKQALWGDTHVSADSVPRCMSSLRERLEPEQCIQTVYKRGYRLAIPVRHHGTEKPAPIRVAILPFAAGHNVPDLLGAAVADEITTRLTEIAPAAISVLARDSVFTLAQRGLTAAQVGETLHADLVMAGTLLAMPTQYRLRVEFIRVEDETQIWVEDAIAAHGRLPELEARIVQRLLFRLGVDTNGGKGNPVSDPPRGDAYELFLRGREEWRTMERHRMQDGMQHLIEATELDASLVSAQVDLADLCVVQECFGFISPEEAGKQIRRIAESIPNAEQEAPSLLPLIGWVKFHIDRDLPGALDLFSASAHLPHGGSTTRVRVLFALSRHRFDEALEWLDAALAVDPYAPCLHSLRAWTLHLARRGTESLEAIEKSMAMFPDHDDAQVFGTLILAFHGHAERAVNLSNDLVRRTPYFDIGSAVQAYALACNGQRDEAHEILERLQWLSRERFVLRSFTAAAFAALGQVEEGIGELQAADGWRCPWFFQMLADPRLDPLRASPEFVQMRESLEKMELTVPENVECHA